VNLAAGIIHVCRSWDAVEGEISPKSAKGTRNVPVPAGLRDVLVEHRMTHAGDGVIFGSLPDVRRAAIRARDRWEAAGLEPLTLHEGRHSYASLMIAAGVNAKALSTFMGHATIGITLDRYAHLMAGAEAEAGGLLDGFLDTARRADPDPDCSANCSAPTESPASSLL
jgi:integrase